jgi:hypothetical protein
MAAISAASPTTSVSTIDDGAEACATGNDASGAMSAGMKMGRVAAANNGAAGTAICKSSE